MGTEKNYYTVAETADLANCSISYIHSLISGGTIKAIKEPAHGHGGFKYQIDAKEVDRILEAKNGAVEVAKDNSKYGNVYIDRTELSKLTGRKIETIKTDESKGLITAVRISSPGRTGFKYGYSVAEVKRYVKYIKDNTPRFITAEEMKELIK